MNLLLTSDGLSDNEIKECFLEEIKKLDNKKIAVLYTVKNPGDEQWLAYREQELDLLNLTYHFINISENRDLSEVLLNYGIIYICGGNTFYILDRIRKTGVDKFLLESINRNLLYVGLSAGSIIMCPDIEVAGIGPDGDDNDICLSDLKGFNIVPFSIYPHYKDEDKLFVEKFFNDNNKPVIAINDNQAIFVKKNNFTLMGDIGELQLGCELRRL